VTDGIIWDNKQGQSRLERKFQVWCLLASIGFHRNFASAPPSETVGHSAFCLYQMRISPRARTYGLIEANKPQENFARFGSRIISWTLVYFLRESYGKGCTGLVSPASQHIMSKYLDADLQKPNQLEL